MHSWVEQDDLMVLFAYKFGFNHSPLNKKQMAERIGTSEGSVGYRLANFAAIEGKGRTDHYAILSKHVHSKYGHLPLEQLKKLAFGTSSAQT